MKEGRQLGLGGPARWGLCLLAALTAAGGEAASAQVADARYRRSPLVGGDPFALLTEGRRSLSLTSRASGGNSALDLEEMGAILLLAERDSLRPVDALDALGLISEGEGLTGYGDGGARLRLGLPVTERLAMGLGLQGRAYGSFRLDDDAVALLRDGNAARQEFALGRTRGDALLTAELGLHAVWRPERISGPWGSRLLLGAGLRYVEPLYYGRALSVLEDRDGILVSPDTVRARVSVASATTSTVDAHGSGVLGDLLARLEWPDRGLALEASLRDVGRIHVDGLVRRREDVDLATTRLDTVVDVLESLSFEVRDTVPDGVSPPAAVAVTVSSWSLLPVRLDGRILVPVGGEFDRPPPATELLSTWRPRPSLPVRAGVRLGGRSGPGIRLGLGWEADRYFVRGSAVTHGGVAGGARGVGGTFGVGFWF